jgi:hypothetical protein
MPTSTLIVAVVALILAQADRPEPKFVEKRKLCAAMTTGKPAARQAAAEKLERIDGRFYKLVIAVRDNDRQTRLDAIDEISHEQDDLAAAMPVIVDFGSEVSASLDPRTWRHDTNVPKIRELVGLVETVGMTEYRDEVAEKFLLSIIEKCVADEPRKRAAASLPRVEVIDEKRRVAVLTKAVKSDVDSVRAAAADTLGAMGKSAASSLDVLKKAKGSGDTRVRDAATRAVKLIEADMRGKGDASK